MLRIIITWVFVLFLCAPAWATPITFGDGSNYWPNHGNSSDNGKDVIGAPQLLGGSVELAGDFLNTVSIDYKSGNMSSWNSLADLLLPGDLFLDLGGDGGWDFIVGTSQVNYTNQPFDAPLYAITGGVSYVLSDYYLNGVGGVGDYREGHPVSLNTGGSLFAPAGTVTFGGFSKPATTSDVETMTWTFGDDIDVTDVNALTLGFTVRCANDVIFETVPFPEDQGSEVPIPGSLWLLGSGVLGMISLHRKTLRG